MVLPGPPGMARSEEVHRLTENVYKVSPATGFGFFFSPFFFFFPFPHFPPLLRRARGLLRGRLE